MGDSLLVVEALTHRYGQRTALNQVSFEVGKGETSGYSARTAAARRRCFGFSAHWSRPAKVRCGCSALTSCASRAKSAGASAWFFNRPALIAS